MRTLPVISLRADEAQLLAIRLEQARDRLSHPDHAPTLQAARPDVSLDLLITDLTEAGTVLRRRLGYLHRENPWN